MIFLRILSLLFFLYLVGFDIRLILDKLALEILKSLKMKIFFHFIKMLMGWWGFLILNLWISFRDTFWIVFWFCSWDLIFSFSYIKQEEFINYLNLLIFLNNLIKTKNQYSLIFLNHLNLNNLHCFYYNNKSLPFLSNFNSLLNLNNLIYY